MPLTQAQEQVLLNLIRNVWELRESVAAGNRTGHYLPAKLDAAQLDTVVNQIVTFLNSQPD